MVIKDMCVFALGENKEAAIKVPQGEIIKFHTTVSIIRLPVKTM